MSVVTLHKSTCLFPSRFISYPRTETNMFPQNLNLTLLVEQQTQDNEWGNFAQRILESGGPTPRNGNKSDQAHPPIHPTKYTNSLQVRNLSVRTRAAITYQFTWWQCLIIFLFLKGNEKRLYEFIVRHFLACCSKDAQGQEVTVEIEIAEERFSASGLTIIARNYLEVYPYDKWYNKVITTRSITHFIADHIELSFVFSTGVMPLFLHR